MNYAYAKKLSEDKISRRLENYQKHGNKALSVEVALDIAFEQFKRSNMYPQNISSDPPLSNGDYSRCVVTILLMFFFFIQ